MKRKEFLKILAWAMAISGALGAWAGDTATLSPIAVDITSTALWRTALSENITLNIPMRAPATSAKLYVTGVHYSATYENITGDTIALTLPAATDAKHENVYELRLVYNDGQEVSTQLGLVVGAAQGDAAVANVQDETESAWQGIRRRGVMRVPAGATSLAVKTGAGDYEAVETGLNGAEGWYALSATEAGTTMDVKVTFDAAATQEVEGLTCIGDGTVLFIR